MHPYTNRLIHESSPYLLQHAHNPVDWFPWCEEAFEKAGVDLYSLTDYPTLLELATKKGMIPEEQQEVLLKWQKDPANWTGVY